MAMDKTRLATAIIAAIRALNPNQDGTHDILLQPYWEAIANEIIEEIKGNMDITTQVPNISTGPSTATGTDVSIL